MLQRIAGFGEALSFRRFGFFSSGLRVVCGKVKDLKGSACTGEALLRFFGVPVSLRIGGNEPSPFPEPLAGTSLSKC